MLYCTSCKLICMRQQLHIENLPLELLASILSHLTLQDRLGTRSLVSSSWDAASRLSVDDIRRSLGADD
jgi:hypothetical protein